ncbi:MAG: FAD-dependent oxidoreductase [Planctomycetes bacterium]|nr:FAD-dependent oxidoreductase [Planctomycetota bacterium]
MTSEIERCEVDVLVVGGGCSGAAAAWQASRMGASTLVAEPTPWLGGMITAAGVSAIDGNEGALGGGLFGRFRAAIEAHYGGAANVRTGWVSNTCFEPQVAAAWLAREVGRSGARVVHGAELEAVLRTGDRIDGARFRCGDRSLEVRARVTIEATEYGDVLAHGDVPFRLGREARTETGEPDAPAAADLELQDITMVATLRRHDGAARPVPRPADHDPGLFDCAVADRCSTPDPELLNHALHDWASFLGYGLLPNGLFMLNWPFHSNDHPALGLFGTAAERAATIAAARRRTLAFVHFMQHDLAHPEWGLAADVYPTADGLPLIPYVRECRRVIAVRDFREQDVVPAAGAERPPLLADGIAVGDYYLDHHHSTEHLPPDRRLGECYPKNAPFQVPYSALVPRMVDGLLCAEKSIGSTHIVNGCARLQPVAMLIGQAAGAAAALAAAAGVEPRVVDVRALQHHLLAEGCQIVPDRSTPPNAPEFAARQLKLLGG